MLYGCALNEVISFIGGSWGKRRVGEVERGVFL
jgi:hypothetical protein